jgi:hypothetical protein
MHLPADPLLRAVALYNRRAPLAKWKPPKLHFDSVTTHHILFQVAKLIRTEMPEEARLIYNEAKRRYSAAKKAQPAAKRRPGLKAVAA